MENKKKLPLNLKELTERIEKNYARLQEPYYQIQNVFADADCDWAGDKEGRALLAFVSHYKINGAIIPCMHDMISKLPEKTNAFGYFGAEPGENFDEQQLSGCSWYLRGLLEYYEQFSDEKMLEYAKSTVEHLYLPLKEKIHSYPLKRNYSNEGGVSGNVLETQNGWKLSSDIGCVFMSIDGLSHYYAVTKDEETQLLIKEMQKVFDSIDVMDLRTQTHCCLTAGRGFVRMYKVTGNSVYLNSAIRIAKKYIECGMTDTYQNYNWWGRPETWTETCAIVDSLMLMIQLYEITGEEDYRVLAARIWHNGFAPAQVDNGGAGADTIVNANQPELYRFSYEAYFCCTMRFAEGLWFAEKHKDLLYAEIGELKKDEKNRYMAGDILYAERIAPSEMLAEIEKCELLAGESDYNAIVKCDGIDLQPLVKNYRIPKNIIETLHQKVVFVD